VIYTLVRLFPSAAALLAWTWLSDGTPADPANFLLLVALASAAVAIAPIRRYWHIRATSRSRRHSNLIG
jgi:hypothetical protein